MIVAATLSLNSFLNSVSPTSPLSAISIERYAAAASVKPHLFTTNCYLLLPCYKDTSMFSTRYGLFFLAFSAPILCYQYFAASFQQNRGVGYNHPSKIRCVDRG